MGNALKPAIDNQMKRLFIEFLCMNGNDKMRAWNDLNRINENVQTIIWPFTNCAGIVTVT